MIFSDLRIKRIDCILHYTPKNLSFSNQNRTNHIIGIQLSGKALQRFRDHEFLLKKNCIYFFNQAENYDVNVFETGESFSIHFTTYEPLNMKSFCLQLQSPDTILNLLKRIEQQFNSEPDSGPGLMSQLYHLFALFETAYTKPYHQSDRKLLEAKQYMDLHFQENHCLTNAAKKCGVSSRRFNDLFRNHYDTTPNQYIIGRKIAKAQELLKIPYLSVTETAELCGFQDIYYFSKAFKKVTGKTPTEFRSHNASFREMK